MLVSHATLEKSGLIKPGTLVRWRYAVKTGEAAASESELGSLRQKIEAELPEAGFTIADRRDPSPQVSRTLERLRQFLTLIGLTALLVGGVGIANAVATFIDKRRKVIATMKSIGATSRMVLGIFLAEVLAVAAMGVVLGLVLGTLAPVVLNALFGDMLPIQAEMTVTPLSIVTALVYGFGVALLFTLWPLGRVERVSASMLFRDEVAPERTLPRPWVIADDARHRRGAHRLCHADLRFKTNRHLFQRRPHRRVRGVLRPRHLRHLGGAPHSAAAAAGAVAGARQSGRRRAA